MNIDNVLVNKKTNIGNLDGMDTSQYKTLRGAKRLMRIEKEGTEKIDTYPYLQRDLWAALAKYQPEVKRHMSPDMSIPHKVLTNLINSPEFESMKAYTQGDPTVAAIGLCNLSKAAIPMVDEINRQIEDKKKKMEDARKKADQKRKEMKDNRKKEDELKKQLDELKKQLEKNPPQPPQPENGQKQEQQHPDQKEQQQQQEQPGQENIPTPEEIVQQLQRALEKAQKKSKKSESATKKAEKDQQKAEAEIEQAIDQAVSSPEATGAAIESARKETGEDAKLIAELFGEGAGKNNGTENMTPDESLFALEALDYLKEDDQFKRIAKLAGNMKKIAMKKQKTLSKQTTLRKGVQQGNEVEKLLPAELLQYAKPETRKEFMRKFAEGETMQYKKTAKEKQGYGHMVVCVDVSSSMNSHLKEQRRSEWAKAVAFGLYSIAAKQNRKMFVVEFENYVTDRYEVSKKDDSIRRLLKPVARGGTSFETALEEAFNIIKTMESYKKADIVFITDGEDSVSDIDKFNELKKKTKTAISTVQITNGDAKNQDLKEISNEYIAYNGEGEGFTDIFNIN